MRVLMLALVLIGSSASAQTMYRCGSTFSQVPCDKSPTAIIASTPAPAGPPRIKGADLCRQAVPQRLSLKDPYSAIVEVNPSFSNVAIQYANQPMLSKQYLVSVNAKNSYGAYVGVKVYYCYLSENETNVLGVSDRPL